MANEAPDFRRLLEQQYLRAERLQARLKSAESRQREPIAIIGASCRFPGDGDTPEAFWEALRGGRDLVTEVPKTRWTVPSDLPPAEPLSPSLPPYANRFP